MKKKYRHLSFKQKQEEHEIIWQGYRKERGCRRGSWINVFQHRRKKHRTVWVAHSFFIMTAAEHREVADFLSRLNARGDDYCRWTYDEHHDKWDTDCGHAHYFTNRGPKDNHFKSCPFCGKRLKEQ